jgi:uncharacterized protein YciI
MKKTTILLATLAMAVAAGLTAGEPPKAADAQSGAPMEFESLQLVLLIRPQQPTDYPPEKLEEIQRAHLAHIGAMAATGKLVIAGPFDEQSDVRFRGLELFRVATVEEARKLAQEDPAVQAGRLEVVSMTWYFQKGALAFPLAKEVAGGK